MDDYWSDPQGTYASRRQDFLAFSARFNVVMRPYAEAVLGTYEELDRQGIPHDGDLDRTTLAQFNKYTYRTPDYQLSCAQDYRKGKPGFQQHIWQATLDPDAVVFALHRGNEDEKSYKYWVGVSRALPSIKTFSSPSSTSRNTRSLAPIPSFQRKLRAMPCHHLDLPRKSFWITRLPYSGARLLIRSSRKRVGSWAENGRDISRCIPRTPRPGHRMVF